MGVGKKSGTYPEWNDEWNVENEKEGNAEWNVENEKEGNEENEVICGTLIGLEPISPYFGRRLLPFYVD